MYLLGAGPGDPELITVRAARRLAEADLVLYDALVHPDLLAHVRPGAELVFVGKRAGRASERQHAINERLIEAARAGRVVARLKGGDPFLFGRGSEEAEALAAAGIEMEIVPGVPSPTAAAEYAGFSLTHRDASSSVAFVTATESADKDRTSHDWSKLATGPQTLVIFMGARKLASLMQLLVDHGRSPATPAVVVEWASLPRQRVVEGTVADIAERAQAAGIGLPALTVVGEVVALRRALRWFDTKPMFGKRVLVTRPADRADELARMLRDEGAEPVRMPAIAIAPPEDPAPLERAVRELDAYAWVVITSATGASALFAEIARQGRDARALGAAKVCAIGPATAAKLASYGVRADLVPEEFRGEAVASAILARHPEGLAGRRILLPRAAVARDVVPDTLRANGALVDVVPAYRNVSPGDAQRAELARAIREGAVDVVTLTAPSTLSSVCEALGDDAASVLAGLTVASIGPITTAAAEKAGVRVDVSAREYTAVGLVESLVEHFRAREGASPR